MLQVDGYLNFRSRLNQITNFFFLFFLRELAVIAMPSHKHFNLQGLHVAVRDQRCRI